MYLTCHINSEIIHGINSTHEMKVLRKKKTCCNSLQFRYSNITNSLTVTTEDELGALHRDLV